MRDIYVNAVLVDFHGEKVTIVPYQVPANVLQLVRRNRSQTLPWQRFMKLLWKSRYSMQAWRRKWLQHSVSISEGLERSVAGVAHLYPMRPQAVDETNVFEFHISWRESI